MSVGTGKGWRTWRNQASFHGKVKKLQDELKERFSKREVPNVQERKGSTQKPRGGDNRPKAT